MDVQHVNLLVSMNYFQALHGAERGEAVALLLSPLRPAFENPSDIEVAQDGSQFTLFLTAPLSAFSQLVGLLSSYGEAVSTFEGPFAFQYESLSDVINFL